VQVVVRDGDTAADIEAKVRLAAVLGTWQATLPKWKESEGGLRTAWRENTEQERLLGVSLTGMDNAPTSGQRGMDELAGTLQRLRSAAATNVAAASDISIGRAAAVTCVKPSGTVSQLVDAASGIHPRHARHCVRRVRGSKGDPLTCFLAEAGVPHEPCVYNRGSMVRSCA
jgi:ribonucleoside-triphosphate reductase (thioredoxin)